MQGKYKRGTWDERQQNAIEFECELLELPTGPFLGHDGVYRLAQWRRVRTRVSPAIFCIPACCPASLVKVFLVNLNVKRLSRGTLLKEAEGMRGSP